MNFQNSDAPQREVDKSKAKIRSLEAEHAKARAKYDKSLPAENDKSNMEEDIQVLEDEEIEEQEILDERERIKSIIKQNDVLKSRIQLDMYTSEN